MWFKNLLLVLLISFQIPLFAKAQEGSAKKDSTVIYKKIEAFSKQSKVTRIIYPWFFKPVATDVRKRRIYKKLIIKPYATFEGKIIRNIEIVSLDPFGYSIADTLEAPKGFLPKTGNDLHIKTLSITIRNLLLIKQDQPFDSLLVKESERLVRSREYIRDVSFSVRSIPFRSDSVDIFIRVLDIWSLIPNGSLSTSSFTADLTERNFLGLGHSFQNVYGMDNSKGVSSYATTYSIPNFKNSYIGARLHFDKLGDENFNREFAIDRPFFSPFAKWAAGVYFAQQYHADSLQTGNGLYIPQDIKLNIQDFWAGNAVQVFKGNSEYDRTTNFITSARFLRKRYLEKPSASLDSLHRYADEKFVLASIGISTRKYVQDRYIFKFGTPEDIPIGRAFSVTGGYQIRNNAGRLYLGARLSYGNYNTWGYLSPIIEYGTFFNAGRAQQGIFSAGCIYFTGLKEIGRWKFRQFVKPQVALGMNLFSYDTLTMNDGHGLDGFHVKGLSGTGRILLTLQTQAYTPWNFIGFRFGPFLNLTLMDILGDTSSGNGSNRMYTQIGLGLLIKNENLVLNAFQISIAFYPTIPGPDQNAFKTNSFRTTDLGFRDFDIGKPGVVTFQ
jgi:hypothetical protein